MVEYYSNLCFRRDGPDLPQDDPAISTVSELRAHRCVAPDRAEERPQVIRCTMCQCVQEHVASVAAHRESRWVVDDRLGHSSPPSRRAMLQDVLNNKFSKLVVAQAPELTHGLIHKAFGLFGWTVLEQPAKHTATIRVLRGLDPGANELFHNEV